MTEFIRDLFANIFGENVILATILIAMLPIIELRGAIPFAMSIDFWGSNALSNIGAFLYSFIGSSLVVPILALLFIPFLNWLKKTKWFSGLANKIENRIKEKTNKIEEDVKNKELATEHKEKIEQVEDKKTQSRYNKKFWLKALGLFAFVAIPLPLTGVYTGTCVGVMLGFNFWETCGIVIFGNLCAGLIITFVCSIFPAFTTIILYIFLGAIVLLLLYGFIKGLVAKKKQKTEVN